MEVREELQRLNRNGSTRMNITLHIKNFGPISDAKLSLRPLTIFVGPNNSGKSYAAMLVHSIVSAYGRPSANMPDHLPASSTDLSDRFVAIVDKIDQLEPKKQRTAIPDSLVNEIAEAYLERNFNHLLPNYIRSNFTPKLNDLVRINETAFSISLLNPTRIHVNYENGQWSTSKFLIPKLRMLIEADDETSDLISINNDADGNMVFTFGTRLPNLVGQTPMSMAGDELPIAIYDKISQDFPQQSHYLPAARSGILQGYRTITASITERVPYAGIKGMQIPPLSGVVATFISSLINMSPHKGVFYNLAEELETSILHGQIWRFGDKHELPEFKYKFLNREISLHNASSTVSEMAPLILYLKHIVDKGSLLIIEEPEAHLHPANQVILARYIAKMVRSGLNILLTTHSQPLLEQLSLLLQASDADQKTRKNMGLDHDEFLLEDEVSPYLFTQTAPGNHTAKPIEYSNDDGISQEEFVKVQAELYNQTICVEQDSS